MIYETGLCVGGILHGEIYYMADGRPEFQVQLPEPYKPDVSTGLFDVSAPVKTQLYKRYGFILVVDVYYFYAQNDYSTKEMHQVLLGHLFERCFKNAER